MITWETWGNSLIFSCHGKKQKSILTSATSTTTPQINDLIGWIFIFEVLTTTRARSNKSFILCLYTKTTRAKQAKAHSSCFVQRDQQGIIAKDLTLRQVFFTLTLSSILMWRFRCSCRRSFLNSLLLQASLGDARDVLLRFISHSRSNFQMVGAELCPSRWLIKIRKERQQ